MFCFLCFSLITEPELRFNDSGLLRASEVKDSARRLLELRITAEIEDFSKAINIILVIACVSAVLELVSRGRRAHSIVSSSFLNSASTSNLFFDAKFISFRKKESKKERKRADLKRYCCRAVLTTGSIVIEAR